MNSSSENFTNLEQAYEYCQSITKLHAKSFYFAAKFLPKDKLRAIFPIYAFCRHVDDEIDEIGDGDEDAAIAAVERWRKNLTWIYQKIEEKSTKKEYENDEIFANSEILNSSSKYVFIAWQDLLQTYNIPQRLPLELIQGVLMDTTTKRYQTFDELYVYCYRVASTVGLMSSEILGYSDKIALRYAEALGIAMQLTNILRDIKEDAAIGRIYLPQEDLRRFNVSEKQIFANQFDENFAAMIRFQIERARFYYAEGEKGIAYLDKDSRFTVLLAARIYAKILDEIEKQNYNIFTKRAHTTKSQKIFSIPKIWFAARRLNLLTTENL